MPLPPSRKRPHGPDDDQGSSGDQGNNVKVVVRIRPQNSREQDGNFKVVVQCMDESILVFDPKENSSFDYGGNRKRPRDLRKRQNRDLKFAFDYVFGPDSTNADVYNETTNVILGGLLDGYNCSVFAYGATGAGKTHTMLGSESHPGVMYHTMMDLYQRIDNMKDQKSCDVAVSYLEVYNETIRDLLLPGGSLPIREDPQRGVMVPGLSLHKPKTADELLYMLQFGNQHRSQHPTDANAESSRSHAVFQVFIRQKDRTANISAEVRVAKLCLVDLAGSERATATSNKGSRFREGANINKSLLALGNVINALAENKKKGFVPYRDSKLTRLLKDSLGGNCQTVMIAAVSPSAMSYEDTYNTLRYADRAKHIKATLKKNVLNVDFHVAKYGQIVKELRKEIVELKARLALYDEGQMVPTTQVTPATGGSPTFVGFQSELSEWYTSHKPLCTDQLQQEVTLRQLQWKMYRKERCRARITTVNEPANMESLMKVETILTGLRQKTSCLNITSESSRSKVVDSYKHLCNIEQKIRDTEKTEDGKIPEVVSMGLQVHKLQCEIDDMRHQLGYTKHVVRCQEKELQHNQRLIEQLLKLLKREHYIIKGHHMSTDDLEAEYVSIQQRVTGQELVWQEDVEGTGYPLAYSLAAMLDLPTLGVRDSVYNGSNDTVPPAIISQPPLSGMSSVPSYAAITRSGQPQGSKVTQQHTAGHTNHYQDECSPPKAKRVMLPDKSQFRAARVDSQGQVQQQSYKGRRTPNKNYRNSSSRRRSYSESNVNTGSGGNLAGSGSQNDKFSFKNNKQLSKNTQSKKLGTSVSDTSEDTSPYCGGDVTNSKFSRINDTITKSKKFSNLHVDAQCDSMKKNVGNISNQSVTVKQTQNGAINHDLDETFTLDSTFTIDPNHNPLPVSAIPCVESEKQTSCDQCGLNNKPDSNSQNNVNLTKPCQKCAISKNSDSRRNSVHANYLGISILNNSQTISTTSSTSCSDCKSQSLTPSEVCSHYVVEAQQYSTCVNDTQTVSQTHNDPQNDSGASTIINQSGNSLASVSTLVESNLSQNLSNIDENVSEGGILNVTVNENKIKSKMENVDDLVLSPNSHSGSSEVTHQEVSDKGSPTVTKLKSGVTSGAIETSSKQDEPEERTCKAHRSIKFDTSDTVVLTPSKALSYADAVRTPTPDRQPLRQVANSNTSMTTPSSEGYGSSHTSEDDYSYNKSRMSDKTVPSRLFDISATGKENCKILKQFGLPSLLGDSILTKNKVNLSKNSSFTPGYMPTNPGYMQTTKAHSHRTKPNTSKNSSLLNSSDGSTKTDTLGDRSKSIFLSRNTRPLSRMRSKSTSNLSTTAGSTRAAWQN